MSIARADRHWPAVPSQRELYLQRHAVVRHDDDGTWDVVYQVNGQQLFTDTGMHSWAAALAAALEWVGLS